MRTDLIGDDFRLDLGDEIDAKRIGTARLAEREVPVEVRPTSCGDFWVDVGGVGFWVERMIDVAPAVKRQMEVT